MKLLKIKLSLILIAGLLVTWNYFLRDNLNIPLLSDMSSTMIYIIAGIILAVDIIINWLTRK